MTQVAKEGLQFARFLMVLSSFWPVFVLWGIKGTDLFDRETWISICAAFIVVPNFILWCRWRIAKRNKEVRALQAVEIRDQREHVIVYLFAVLLPLFDANQYDVYDS